MPSTTTGVCRTYGWTGERAEPGHRGAVKRRYFLVGAGAALAWPAGATAQSPRTRPHVGVLVAESAPHPFTEAFRAGMRELGYAEGRTVTITWRYADGLLERAVEQAAELVRLKVDVIAAHHTPAVKASMSAGGGIPIVMAPAGAPVQAGLVKSLAQPGGNVTGLSSMEAELGTKRLQLLAELIPGLKRVALLGARTDPFTKPFVGDFQDAANRMGLHLQPVLIDGVSDFDGAFAEMAKAGAQAVVIQPLFQPHSARVLDLAGRHRLAIMSSYRDTTQAGGLISYSADHAAYFRRAAIFVDKILKGAKPADLPVEQPEKFELVINLKTAKTLGLTVPQSVLVAADEIIQ